MLGNLCVSGRLCVRVGEALCACRGGFFRIEGLVNLRKEATCLVNDE